jgi:hypothetical protein
MITTRKLAQVVILWVLATAVAFFLPWYHSSLNPLVFQAWLMGVLVGAGIIALSIMASKINKHFALWLLVVILAGNYIYFGMIDPEKVRSRMLLLAAIFAVLNIAIYLTLKWKGSVENVGPRDRCEGLDRGSSEDT